MTIDSLNRSRSISQRICCIQNFDTSKFEEDSALSFWWCDYAYKWCGCCNKVDNLSFVMPTNSMNDKCYLWGKNSIFMLVLYTIYGRKQRIVTRMVYGNHLDNENAVSVQLLKTVQDLYVSKCKNKRHANTLHFCPVYLGCFVIDWKYNGMCATKKKLVFESSGTDNFEGSWG